MKKVIVGVFGAAALAVNATAFASEVEAKCIAAVENLGGAYADTDAAEGCACFAEQISGDEALIETYLSMDTDSEEAWSSAPDELKDAGSACFPGT